MPDSYRLDILHRAQVALGEALARSSIEQRRVIIGVCAKTFHQLETRPFDFGEELYDLKSIGMQVRIGIQLPVVLHFGADEKNRIVIIQNAMILS